MNSKYIVLDTETAGLPTRKGFNTYHNPKEYDIYYKECRMIELGYVIYKNDTHEEVKEYEGMVIPEGFQINNHQFHGITNEKATNEGKPIVEVLTNLQDDLQDCHVIVGHNIKFDIHILLAECYRHDMIELSKLIIDKFLYCTMVAGKKLLKTKKYPKLTELYKHIFNEEFNQEHRALSDVKAAADCYQHMV